MSTFRTSPEVKALIARARELEDGSIEKDKLEAQLMFLCGFLLLHWYGSDSDNYELPPDDGDEVLLGDGVARPSTVDGRSFALIQRTINV